jgi:hypothetical protein
MNRKSYNRPRKTRRLRRQKGFKITAKQRKAIYEGSERFLKGSSERIKKGTGVLRERVREFLRKRKDKYRIATQKQEEEDFEPYPEKMDTVRKATKKVKIH